LANESVNGEIFVLSGPSNTNAVVGDFSSSGATINSSLMHLFATNNFGNGGLAYDGNGHLFAGSGKGVIEYTTTGTNAITSLISSLNDVFSVVVDSGHLFVIWVTPQWVPLVAEFTTNGTPINVSLISLNGKNCVSLKGDGDGHLFLLTGNTIEEYATSGAALYLPLVTFSSYCSAFAVDGNGYTYVANGNGNTTTISKYTTSGTLVNASLISGLPSVFVTDMTLDGNGNLLLLIWGSLGNYVSEYTTSGQLISSSLISGIQSFPTSIISIPAVQPTVKLIKAVVPTFSDLLIGTNYQLQISGDLNTWTNQGAVFMATNSTMTYPQYWIVNNWSQLFFRLQVAP
jgi:hypothetical protein